jgi:hypothetical protein
MIDENLHASEFVEHLELENKELNKKFEGLKLEKKMRNDNLKYF